MRTPGLSIIIPHLNQPVFLARCLRTLGPQVQCLDSVEIIVVDNGSVVLPVEICAEWPAVCLASEAEAGPGPARNRGIALSRHDLLAFIDADCVAGDEWVTSIVRAFADDPSLQVAGGDVRILYADSARLTALEAYESVFAYRQQEYIEKKGFSGTGNLAMRAEIFDRVGPFAGIALAEDRDWGQRALQMGVRIRYCSNIVVFHPARKTFAELRAKWDRHMEHDFNATARSAGARAQWTARAVAVAGSGLLDVRKVIASRCIAGARARVLASVMLLRIRLYRAWRMMCLAVAVPRRSGPAWNRP